MVYFCVLAYTYYRLKANILVADKSAYRKIVYIKLRAYINKGSVIPGNILRSL